MTGHLLTDFDFDHSSMSKLESSTNVRDNGSSSLTSLSIPLTRPGFDIEVVKKWLLMQDPQASGFLGPLSARLSLPELQRGLSRVY